MKSLLVLAAENISIDQSTRRMSIFNLLEELSAAGFPGMLPSVAVLVLLERVGIEPEKVPLRISATLNNDTLFDLPFDADFQGKLRTRGIINLQGIVLPAAGMLTFLI
jgi:hypothetical protein